MDEPMNFGGYEPTPEESEAARLAAMLALEEEDSDLDSSEVQMKHSLGYEPTPEESEAARLAAMSALEKEK